jgi:tripartite-type tricarboxylate transporter receptor subunit TctC
MGVLCADAGICGFAQAQTYPSKPIEFVLATSPGAGTDLFVRAITGMLEKEKIFSPPIVIYNRVGEGVVVAYTYIKNLHQEAARRSPRRSGDRNWRNTQRLRQAGAGSTPQYLSPRSLHLVERETGATFKYVSFKGGGEAVLATLGATRRDHRREHERDAAAR